MTMTKRTCLTGRDNPIVAALMDAGFADNNTRRVVIDLEVGKPPKVYAEKYGDENVTKVIEVLFGTQVEETKA